MPEASAACGSWFDVAVEQKQKRYWRLILASKKRGGALSPHEKKIVKALINRGERHQDIQYLINIGRKDTVNSARITEVKNNNRQKPATDKKLALFKLDKSLFDSRTQLSPITDRRIVSAREAMLGAVQLFNNPNSHFRINTFPVLAIIAWTYILHDFFEKNGRNILKNNGRAISLQSMLRKTDCPLTPPEKENLQKLIKIRNDIEHYQAVGADSVSILVFQACCLVFDRFLIEEYGEHRSISSEIGVALQFANLEFSQLTELSNADLPHKLKSLNKLLYDGVKEDIANDTAYAFRIVYTLDSATKGQAHVRFLNPESAEGKQIRDVLVKTDSGNKRYPYKPKDVAKLVNKKLAATGHNFNIHHHSNA